ncbi:MAG: cation:proton antiporter [Victivallaceae bacterium]|nr:cation:proton antiporter [Victivallaceae bacterium]
MNNDFFLIIFLVFMVVMTVSPLALRRFNIPAVIALLLVGMVLGPHGLDLVRLLAELFGFLSPDATPLIVNHVNNLINSLGVLGLVFLMALAGTEADFNSISQVKKPTIMLSVMTFLIPALAGYYVYAYFRPDDLPGKLLYASLFASHSVGIVFPVIRELKIAKTKFGVSVLMSTVVTDIASIVLLAMAVQMRRQDGVGSTHRTLSIFDSYPGIFGDYFMIGFLVVVVLYLALALVTVPWLANLFFRVIDAGEDGLVTTLLMIIAGVVLVGEVLGINLVVGAFAAGLALAPFLRRRERNDIFRKLEGIGYGFLIPFLFISIGMETNFAVLFTKGSITGNMAIILLTVIGLVVSKIGSGFLALRISGFPSAQGFCAGLMTVPQLSATLAAASIGKSLGILDTNFFNAVVVMSIVTTLPVPTLVRILIKRKHIEFEPLKHGRLHLPPPDGDELI